MVLCIIGIGSVVGMLDLGVLFLCIMVLGVLRCFWYLLIFSSIVVVFLFDNG